MRRRTIRESEPHREAYVSTGLFEPRPSRGINIAPRFGIRSFVENGFLEQAMITQPNSGRRMYYRVRFPLADQPRWIVGNTNFAVIDLSETSCQLDRLGHGVIELGMSLSGILRFADGDEVWVEGDIMRQDADGIVVRFTKGVTLKKMMALQRWLFQRYPVLRDVESPKRITSLR